MISIQKIAEWYNNHRIARAITKGAAGVAAFNTVEAALDILVGNVITEAQADFYDASRAPEDKRMQLDQRIYSRGQKGSEYRIIVKYYGKDENGIFLALPVSYVVGDEPEGRITKVAGVVAYFAKFGNKNNITVRPLLSVDYNRAEGSIGANPMFYVTGVYGNLTVDPRVSYGTNGLSYGTTVGYGIGLVRAGFDINRNPIKGKFEKQFVTRVDLDPGHKNWIQFYVGPDKVGVGFRTNFKFNKK